MIVWLIRDNRVGALLLDIPSASFGLRFACPHDYRSQNNYFHASMSIYFAHRDNKKTFTQGKRFTIARERLELSTSRV